MTSTSEQACRVCGGDAEDESWLAAPVGRGGHPGNPFDLLRWLAEHGIPENQVCARCAAGQVPSPCVRTCQIDKRTATCRGCARTMSEIVDWPSMDPIARARVRLRLRRR